MGKLEVKIRVGLSDGFLSVSQVKFPCRIEVFV